MTKTNFIAREATQMGDDLSIKELIQSNIYEGDFGYKYINIPNSRLDFSQKFVFLGFTKSGNVRLGDIHSYGQEGIKFSNKIAKFDGKYLSALGSRYLKSIKEMQEDSI